MFLWYIFRLLGNNHTFYLHKIKVKETKNYRIIVKYMWNKKRKKDHLSLSFCFHGNPWYAYAYVLNGDDNTNTNVSYQDEKLLLIEDGIKRMQVQRPMVITTIGDIPIY